MTQLIPETGLKRPIDRRIGQVRDGICPACGCQLETEPDFEVCSKGHRWFIQLIGGVEYLATIRLPK